MRPRHRSPARLMGAMLCLLAARAALAPRARAQGAMAANKDYWYVDIYKPFFAEKKEADGRVMMVSQRERAREQSFPKLKTRDAIRIFILGGSVGYQYDSNTKQSHGWSLQNVLASVFPGKNFEVIHCGMGGYDSYRERLLLKELLTYEPDIIVLLSGNNDVADGAGPPPLLVRYFPRIIPFQRRLNRLWRKHAGGENRALQDQSGRQIDLFKRNVRAMVRRAKARNTAMVLCTMPRQQGLPPAGANPGTNAFLDAWAFLEEGRWGDAEKLLMRRIQEEPKDPFGPYWLGKLMERRGDKAAAREAYDHALRNDHSRVSEINDIIRKIAVEEGAVVADLENIFNRESPGPRNGELLYDAMHWNRFADPQVSMAIAQALRNTEQAGLKQAYSQAAVPTLWRKFKNLKPTDREGAEIFRRKAMGALWESSLGMGFFFERSVGTLEDLYRDKPRMLTDVLLRKKEFGEHLGVWTEGQRGEWESRWAVGLAHVGEALRRQGLPKEALRYFDAARAAGCALPILETHRALAQRALTGKGKSVRAIIREGYKAP